MVFLDVILVLEFQWQYFRTQFRDHLWVLSILVVWDVPPLLDRVTAVVEDLESSFPDASLLPPPPSL